MGVYDEFIGEAYAQLKCFYCELKEYKIGDKVPVKEFRFPETCTFCDWGGKSKKFKSKNVIDKEEYMGIFVVIKNSKLEHVTEDDTKIKYPVFDKYGELLAQKEER